MIGQLLRHTPRLIVAILGLACALLVLELQRMPAVQWVHFSIFDPIPYFVEVVIILLVACLYWFKPEIRLADSRVVRIFIGTVVSVCSLVVLNGFFSENMVVSLVFQGAYRASGALLFLLWAERLLCFGARRVALCFGIACLVSASITLVFSAVGQTLSFIMVCSVPVVASVLFVVFRATGPLPTSGSDGSENIDTPLPRFSCRTKKESIIAFGLILLPLLCRGPVVSIQSLWMPYQADPSTSFLIQLSIAAGVVLAGFMVLVVCRFAWNRNFILVYEFFVLPVTFLAFYTSQASSSLWFIYLLIIDATYKVTLFYLFVTPFLFPGRKNPLLPLLLSFAFMIFARALFSLLSVELPESAFAAISAVVVLATFVGGGILAFLVVQKSVSFSAGTEEESVPPQGISLEAKCEILTRHFELTAREAEILVLLAQRYHAPYIAKKLFVSQSTVKTHMRNLYGKLGVHSQADLLLLVDGVEDLSVTDRL